MNLILISTLILCFFKIANAVPELRSAKALKTQLIGPSFSAKLSPGFHFNDKAPNGIQVEGSLIKSTVFLPTELVVNALPKSAQNGIAHLYVCDDKVTFCELHTIPLGKKSKMAALPLNKKSAPKLDEHGFILNDFESALLQAKKQNKMLLVDFGARWCPACLRIEKEIFGDKVFQKNSKSFVKAKIDVDLFSSSVLEEKYNVIGVPTVLFLTKEGQEIIRFYDFQSMDFINDVFKEIKTNPMAIDEMEKQEESTSTQRSLAKRYYFSGQYSKAISRMENIDPKPKEYWFAKVAEAKKLAKEDSKLKDKYRETLRSAIATDPKSTRSLVWRSELVEALEKTNQDVLRLAGESRKLTEELLQDRDLLKQAVENDFLGEYTGLEGFYVAMINAETSEAANFEVKTAWEAVIGQGEKYQIGPIFPGAALRLLTAMIKAEKYDKALSLVNDLLKSKPNDGDLQRRKMRVLLELKRFDESVMIGEKALKNSYGINEYFVVEPLAKAYLGLGKKAQAKSLISRYLDKNEIHFSDLKGIKEKLEKLRSEL